MGPESTLVAGSGALGALPEHEPVGIFSDVNRLSNKYINSIRNLYHEDFPSGNIFFSGLLFTKEKVST